MTSELSRVDHKALSENDARELTAKIYGHLDAAWNLITEAYYGSADQAMGYSSWDEYCKAEFLGAKLRLPREKRKEVVATLNEAGLPERAIAAATGMGRTQVHRDLKPNDQSAPNGAKTSTSAQDLRAAVEETAQQEEEIAEAEIVSEDQDPPGFNPPEVLPRRRPIADNARELLVRLAREADKLPDIVNDDRFPANRETIKRQCQPLIDEIEQHLTEIKQHL